MKTVKKMFDNQLLPASRRWMAMCGLLAALIGVGWATGLLQVICVTLILAVAIILGVRPHWKFAGRFSPHCSLAGTEFAIMRKIPLDELPEWDRNLATMDLREAGPVLKMYAAISKNKDRTSKNEAAKRFIELEQQYWYEQIASVADAGEICCLMGLLGSLLGILQAVSGGGGVAVIEQSMGVMAATSAIGAACAIMLMGLSTRGENAIARHIAELGIAANLMPDVSLPTEPEDDFISLF